MNEGKGAVYPGSHDHARWELAECRAVSAWGIEDGGAGARLDAKFVDERSARVSSHGWLRILPTRRTLRVDGRAAFAAGAEPRLQPRNQHRPQTAALNYASKTRGSASVGEPTAVPDSP